MPYLRALSIPTVQYVHGKKVSREHNYSCKSCCDHSLVPVAGDVNMASASFLHCEAPGGNNIDSRLIPVNHQLS